MDDGRETKLGIGKKWRDAVSRTLETFLKGNDDVSGSRVRKLILELGKNGKMRLKIEFTKNDPNEGVFVNGVDAKRCKEESHYKMLQRNVSGRKEMGEATNQWYY